MWYLRSTEKWIDDVIKRINEKQLNPKDSKFMIVFFSSLDKEFVEYFQNNKEQITSYSGQNFHIFTPLIFEDKIIPDDDWRNIKREFHTYGIPVKSDPTFVFFKLELRNDIYEPIFFAGFEFNSFDNFAKKLKYAIDATIDISEIRALQQELTEIFLSKNIIPVDNVNLELKQTFINKLPKSKIFISHSSIDKPFVRKLIRELSNDENLNFWIDEKEIMPGDDIQKTITSNLKQSDYLILIISENSVKSNWVNFEVSQFMGFAKDKNIIPIIISENQQFIEPIDNLIRRLNYLDFSESKKWKRNIKELRAVLSQKDNVTINNINTEIKNSVVGNNNKVIINQVQKKKTVQKYPEGCVGFETIKANYIGHLINRYNEYKEYEVGKGQVKYAVFAGHLKKKFKISPTRTLYNIHINKFEELVNYIQSRIDGTKLAKVNKGKGNKNYSSYEDFEEEQI